MKWYFLVYCFLEDYWLIFRNRCLYNLQKNPPQKWKTGDKGDVILIPGLNARWVSLKKIAEAINKQGYRIHIINKLDDNSKPVIHATSDVAEYIRTKDLKDVIIIGHSKGGVVAIYLLKDPEIAKRIKVVINIAGPIKGTLLSWFSGTGKELVPTSDFINHYREGIKTKKVIDLYPLIDDFVIPNANLIEENYTNKKINVVGHMRIVESKKTIEEIKTLLISPG